MKYLKYFQNRKSNYFDCDESNQQSIRSINVIIAAVCYNIQMKKTELSAERSKAQSHIDSLFELIESETKNYHSHKSLLKDINDGHIFKFIRSGKLDAVKKKLLSIQNHTAIKFSLNHRSLSYSGRTILQEACAQNQIEIVKFLLENYPCNDKKLKHHKNEFHTNVKDVFEFDINKKSNIGQDTALHFAVRNNNKVITRILLNYRANPNIPNKYGATPLHYVQSVDIAHLLHSYNADSTLVDVNGRTPSMYISYMNNTCSSHCFTLYDDDNLIATKLIKYLVDAEEGDTKEAIQRELRAHRIQKERNQDL